jgi:type III secretion translocon protein HrpF
VGISPGAAGTCVGTEEGRERLADCSSDGTDEGARLLVGSDGKLVADGTTADGADEGGALIVDGASVWTYTFDGLTLGSSDGTTEGLLESNTLGSFDGKTLGSSDGETEGSLDSNTLGSFDGTTEGSVEIVLGVIDGTSVGSDEGRAPTADDRSVGAEVGSRLEVADGISDGKLGTDGTFDGADEGR